MPTPNHSLETLCWDPQWEDSFAQDRLQGWLPARVAVEDKHHYGLLGAPEPLIGKVSGKLLHATRDKAQLPKVGDWVAYSMVPREKKALIHRVLPRRTKLARRAVGRKTIEQVLVTNVDVAFVVQALDQSFNRARIQRHLAMVVEGGVKPVIVLNKSDLCRDILGKLAAVEAVADRAPVIAVSARTGRAMESLSQLVRPGQTVVFVGSSGVGKSSLINHLYGEEVLATTEVRESDAKGRHTTSWRELIVLPQGGLVIDTPGLREFQMWLSGETGQDAFADVEEIALQCHFPNCSHRAEERCAVLAAVESGTLSRARLDQYLKLKSELHGLGLAARRRAGLESQRQARSASRALERRKFSPTETESGED